MSTVSYDQSYRTTGGLQRFDCLAWVNFNGTGTVAIRASGNVSSITDNGTGDYTVNFTNALPDADYAVVPMTQSGATTSTTRAVVLYASSDTVDPATKSTTQCRVLCGATNAATLIDMNTVTLVFFR